MNALMLRVIAGVLIVAGTAAASTADASFPVPISSSLPIYPEGARAAHVAGTVKLWFTVNENGEIAQTGNISGNPLLREAAVSVVKSWKFRPNMFRLDVRLETEFVYVLNVQPKEGEPKLTVSMTDYRQVEVSSELFVKPIE